MPLLDLNWYRTWQRQHHVARLYDNWAKKRLANSVASCTERDAQAAVNMYDTDLNSIKEAVLKAIPAVIFSLKEIMLSAVNIL